MCKIVVFTNVSEVKKIDKLIDVVSGELAKYESDGFGYAIEGTNGVFGERSLETDNFKSSMGRKTLSFNWLTELNNSFGVKSKVNGAAIFHGRTSTNDVNILNTHPIVKNGHYLIHNGVEIGRAHV